MTDVLRMPDELLTAGVLPSPPGVVMDVFRLVADDDSTAEDLAAVIETDPVLAGRLLGTVNSGLYSLSREIHGITQAAVLLGFRAVRSLALGVSVTGGLPDGSRCPGFDLGLYWRHSLMTAIVGRGLAGRIERRLSDDAFSVGLIANVGRLVVAHCIPERYTRALATTSWPDHRTEEAVLGYSTALVSAALLDRWGLPRGMCLAVRYVDDLERLPDGIDHVTRETARIVSAADTAVDHLLAADGDEAIHAVGAELSATVALEPATIAGVLTESAEQIGQVRHLIADNLPDGLSPADFVAQAQDLLKHAAH